MPAHNQSQPHALNAAVAACKSCFAACLREAAVQALPRRPALLTRARAA